MNSYSGSFARIINIFSIKEGRSTLCVSNGALLVRGFFFTNLGFFGDLLCISLISPGPLYSGMGGGGAAPDLAL